MAQGEREGERGGKGYVHQRPWLRPPFFVWKCSAGRRGEQLHCQMPSVKRPFSGTISTWLLRRAWPWLRRWNMVEMMHLVEGHGSGT